MILRSYKPGTDDYVDNNLSNADSYANKGTESNFTAQQYGPDSIYDMLTEENTGGSSSFGSSIGSSYTTVSANRMYGSVFTSPADSENATLQSITWYGRTSGAGSGNAKAVLVLASTIAIIAVSDPVSFSNTGQEQKNTFASPPTISANTNYILMMIFDVTTRFYYTAGSTNQGYVDTTNSYASPTNPTDSTNNSNCFRIKATYFRPDNYELDVEAQWTNVDYSQAHEELAIHARASSGEVIRVDVWNGAAWQNVFAGLSDGWNNVSVSSYLTSQNFTIRFKGSSETGDAIQDTWNIDAVVLHVWSDEYTAEVEFTGVSNMENWTQLNWTINTAWAVASVSVTIQLYNFSSGTYQTSGFGYATYTSSATPNTDENSTQSTSVRTSDFRNAAGDWKIKIKGVKTGATQFDLKADFVEFHEAKQGGAMLTFENGGSLTFHVVSIWINNSTSHQRFSADVFINSGETLSQVYPNVNLPNGTYTVKVATERGNMAILPVS